MYQRSTLSTTVTAQTCYLRIKVQINAIASRELIRMTCFSNIHFTPRKCRSRHNAVCNECSTLSLSIGQSSPTYLFVITHGLWLTQNDFIAHLLTEDLNVLTYLAVVEVINRTTTIISEVYIFLRQLHGITQTRQIGSRLVRVYRTLQLDRAIRINGPNLIGSKLEIIYTERL